MMYETLLLRTRANSDIHGSEICTLCSQRTPWSLSKRYVEEYQVLSVLTGRAA